MRGTVQAAMAAAVRALTKAGVATPQRDARALMAAAMDVPADRIILHQGDPLPTGTQERFDRLISFRLKRQPVSKILGFREFFGRRFLVNLDVLDPRPETETLIELALLAPFQRLLDLGTGSGNIAVTLLAECTDATGLACDISEFALSTAAENASLHGIGDRLCCEASDWFDSITGRYDLIASNPPYITADEIPALQPEVRDFDPRAALTDEGDGLAAYRAIAARAGEFLTPGGRLLLEIGPTQAAKVSELLLSAGLTSVAVYPDIDGRDRVVGAFAPSKPLQAGKKPRS